MRILVLAFLFYTTPVLAHGIYTHWLTVEGWSCCNESDCHVSYSVRVVDNHYEVLEGNTWYEVPKKAVRPYESPDGLSHTCFYAGEVRCFVPGYGT